MNRAITIVIDTHADDYYSQHGKTCRLVLLASSI